MLILQDGKVLNVASVVDLNGFDAVFYGRNQKNVVFYLGGSVVCNQVNIDGEGWKSFHTQLKTIFNNSTQWTAFKDSAIIERSESNSPNKTNVKVNFSSEELTI